MQAIEIRRKIVDKYCFMSLVYLVGTFSIYCNPSFSQIQNESNINLRCADFVGAMYNDVLVYTRHILRCVTTCTYYYKVSLCYIFISDCALALIFSSFPFIFIKNLRVL